MQKYLFAVICLLFFACAVPDKNTIPEDVIPKDKMERILYDLHMVEGIIAVFPTQGDSNAQRALGYYDEVYAKHQITKEEFVKSFDFYVKHPVLMDTVYTRMIERFNEEELLLRK